MRTIGGGDRNPSSGLIPADPFYLFFCYLTGKKIDEKESARGKEDEDDEEEKKKEDGLCCCGGGVVLEIEIHPPARPPISCWIEQEQQWRPGAAVAAATAAD